jgi:hypothetical protein
MHKASHGYLPSGLRGPALLVFLALVLSGCTAGAGRVQETSFPREHLPTVIAQTIQAMETPDSSTPIPEPTHPSPTAAAEETPDLPEPSPTEAAPEETPTPLVSTPTPAGTPLPTRTPTPTPMAPFAHIQITRPGPASKVTSPIRVGASLFPGARGNVRLELLGEDGRVLFRKIETYQNNQTVRINITLDVEFEISAVAEAARLVISTEDSHGRLVALASTDLILLSVGEDELNPAGDLLETIVIREPARNLLVQGGNLNVSGLARPRGRSPLLVQLINIEGKQVSSAQLIEVVPQEDGGHFPFSINVPYAVEATTWVRVWISERDYTTNTTLHLSSVEVLLSP